MRKLLLFGNMFLLILFLWLTAMLDSSDAVDDKYHPLTMMLPTKRNIGDRAIGQGKHTPAEEKESAFWLEQAKVDLWKKLNRRPITHKAKNIIMFLGDGMSIATMTAARILKGQLVGKTGEESKLAVDEMPYAGLSRTYCTNGQTPDSACTATAYLCGIKTNLLTIGVNGNAIFNNCSTSANGRNHVESIATWAQRAGKSTGIVTTTTVTHASPAGAYAHVANRMWESDADIVDSGADPNEGCVDIATQLIMHEPGRNFDVILGGGSTNFLPESTEDAFGEYGRRLDNVNLLQQWKQQNPQGAFVSTRDQLAAAVNGSNALPTRLLGLFNSEHMEYHRFAAETRPTEPRLKDMTEAAIRMLQRNKKGYFVFIEGGRIDHGHHQTQAGLALYEMLEFDAAIETALRLTNERDTQIVVTADHSHTMTIAGYPGRGNPILGINEYDTDIFGTPYATLNYAVGVDQYLRRNGNGRRLDLTGQLNDVSHTPSYIKAALGTHAGEDVAIFASGPYAHLFSGINQQNIIPHIMGFAAGIETSAGVKQPHMFNETDSS